MSFTKGTLFPKKIILSRKGKKNSFYFPTSMKTVYKARVENRNTKACNVQKSSGAGVPGLFGRSVADFSLFSVHSPREVTLLGPFL